MSIIYILLPFALFLGFGFLAAFIYASNSGQYDDLDTPAYRMLLEDEIKKPDLTNPERKFNVE